MPEETKNEETNENPVEEETTEEEPKEETQEEPQEETPPVVKETPKEKTEDQYTDREKRYYARMKKAEDEAKKAKEALIKAKVPISDIDSILEVQSSTKDLDAQEIAELKLRANALGTSLTEARKDPNYTIWLTGYREKVEKELAAKPSTLQPEADRPQNVVDQLREAEKLPVGERIEKKAEILANARMGGKQGLWKNPRRREASQKIPLSQNQ